MILDCQKNEVTYGELEAVVVVKLVLWVHGVILAEPGHSRALFDPYGVTSHSVMGQLLNGGTI